MPDSSAAGEWLTDFRRSAAYRQLQKRPVAYFCAEFALDPAIPTYAGGLGILSGDVVREAADQQLPMVGVGLYYSEGFSGRQIPGKGSELFRLPPWKTGLQRVVDSGGAPVVVTVPILDRRVSVQAWTYAERGVPVYLLDTDVPENDIQDRIITNRLYTSAKEVRLKQEMILGIGGLRLLQALRIHPSVYHLNEGHSAMLALELADHEVREHTIGFADACQLARNRVVFTNHTLVAAGDDVYSYDLAAALLSGYAQELRVPVHDLIEIGLVQESNLFSMTMLSLRLADRVNAVSQLHAKLAARIWTDHPMMGITNGIHLGTWDRIGEIADPGSGAPALWAAHQRNKERLLQEMVKTTGHRFGIDDLLLGWARRITAYKRPAAVVGDVDGLVAVMNRADHPVRLVMSGAAHPHDVEGKRLLGELSGFLAGRLAGKAVYLPNYGMELAGLMTAGCDVWLNTPVVGFEACGTSGMKAGLNGVLPLSTRDGWIDEIETFGIGWMLDNDRVTESMLDELRRHVLPMFAARGGDGVPREWLGNMSHARELIRSRFSATRMLREYVEKLYLPVLG